LAIQEVQESVLRGVTRQAVEAMGQAVSTLTSIMLDVDAPAGSRVSAARAVLNHGAKLHESMSLAERLDALERAEDEASSSQSANWR
jgi:hypothetical protein